MGDTRCKKKEIRYGRVREDIMKDRNEKGREKASRP
jgi:hypothetical protein